MALTDNILAYWKLDANGSALSLADSTGNGNTLTNSGGVGLGTGKIGGCAVFDGTNSLIANNGFNFGSGNFSVSLWYYPTSNFSGTYGGIIDSRSGEASGFYLGYNETENTIDAFFEGTFLGISRTLNLNAWNYIVLSANAGVFSLSVNNGTPAQSSSVSYDFTSASAYIGRTVDAFHITGSIDEVGLWNRALSAAEVTALYNSGDGISYPFVSNVYFNAAVDGNLATLGNWWKNGGFTIPADALPDNSTSVFISAPVTSGTATYADATISANIGSAVSITANTITLNSGINSGTLIGPVVLNNSSSNAGTITGNATIYYPSANPIGGAVSGTETYIWPNGTGLWGNEVWIDGSSSFIIPIESDVRTGVEYGPASAPYTGTYSGGGTAKTISISQLLKLPFPINV